VRTGNGSGAKLANANMTRKPNAKPRILKGAARISKIHQTRANDMYRRDEELEEAKEAIFDLIFILDAAVVRVELEQNGHNTMLQAWLPTAREALERYSKRWGSDNA
jgi:hypothetical protein